jgi:endonuclease/exonuclease/phosphatase family metal-dependent hydrolase
MAHLRGVGWLRLAIGMSIALMFGGLGAVRAAAGTDNGDLTVMTRNLDTGTDFGYLFGLGALPDPIAAVVATYQEVLANDPAGRAGRIADEIRATKPDLVALQEVDLWRLAPLTNPTQETVTVDQLQEQLDALTARGLHYSAVVVAQNLNVQVPTTALGFVRFTDRDVILARSDEPAGRMSLSNAQTQHFVSALAIPSALGNVTVLRSWESVDVTTSGRMVRFIATHLEAFDPVTQTGQAHEITTGPGNTTLPLILAGDMNSGPGTETFGYDQLLQDGFSDTWTTTQSGQSGFTWPLYLEDPTVPFPAGPFERIDMVLTRGGVAPATDSRVGLSAPFGSDHVGVVSKLSPSPSPSPSAGRLSASPSPSNPTLPRAGDLGGSTLPEAGGRGGSTPWIAGVAAVFLALVGLLFAARRYRWSVH